ncbi:MAG: aminoglycoside phosphotransferase family protein [Planctomycetota bacterium]
MAERRYPFLELTSEEIADRVNSAVGGIVIVQSDPVPSGAANTLYRVADAERREYCLKLYTRDRDACARETALLRRAHGRVPVPRVLGRVLDAEVPFAVLSWEPGRTLATVLPDVSPVTAARLGQVLGRVLAGIHEDGFDRTGELHAGALDGDMTVTPWPGEGISWYVREALGSQAGQRLGPEIAERLLAFCLEHADEIDRECKATNLVHGDFNPSNILVEREGRDFRVTAVVDWEWSHSGTPLHDFGNILRDRGGWPTDDFREALVAAYEEVAGPLPESWERKADLLEFTSALEFLNQKEDRPGYQAGAAKRIRMALDRWTR